ncbi:hypothetical protein ACWGBO_30120 [[Kitasatospora] papulosa]
MLTADDLTAAEQQVVAAVGRGQTEDLRAGDAATDDPGRGASWPAERTIRAEVCLEGPHPYSAGRQRLAATWTIFPARRSLETPKGGVPSLEELGSAVLCRCLQYRPRHLSTPQRRQPS